MIPLVDLKWLHQNLEDELLDACKQVLRSAAFINGPFLNTFENNFAAMMDAQHCVGVGSGTAALHLTLKSLHLTQGDEVLIPANTFVATAEAVVACGATPIFVDVNEDDFHMNLQDLANKITNKTKVMIPVHLYGLACDLDPLCQVALDNNIAVINDAAQAHLARYKNKPLDDYALASCWSFYPGKNLGALGDAGAVTTNSRDVSQQVRLFSDHGCPKKYVHEVPGYTDRLDALQASFLTVKLKYLEKWTELRKQKAKVYDNLLKDTVIDSPLIFNDRDHVYHLYVIKVKQRDKVFEDMTDKKIGVGIHYPYALTQTPSMEPWVKESCPIAESLSREIISLPLHPGLTDEQQQIVVDCLIQTIDKYY